MDESCCPIVDIIPGHNSKPKSQKAKNIILGEKLLGLKPYIRSKILNPKKEKKWLKNAWKKFHIKTKDRKLKLRSKKKKKKTSYINKSLDNYIIHIPIS